MTKPARLWPLFLLAATLFYFYGTGRLPLVGPDEPRYAEVAREMFLRGDMVTPTLGGHTWFEKPALLYWTMMAGYKLFGVSEFAARLGPALAGLLTALLVYWAGRRVCCGATEAQAREKDAGLGLWAAVAAASSAGMIAFSRAASFDVLVTCTMTAALACFLVAEIEEKEKRRRLFLTGFYAGIGASLLAKGLVGVVLPFGVVGLFYLLRREWPRRQFTLSLLWGVPLACVVAALWYAPVIARHGWTFVDEFFIQHHFARFVSDKYHHPQPFYFYVPIVLALALPWTAFLVAALLNARRWKWRKKAAEGETKSKSESKEKNEAESPTESKALIFALSWLVVPVVFFSISRSKLPGYVLPALPGAMLLVGGRLARFVRGEGSESLMRWTGALLLLLASGGVSYALKTGDVTLACALLIVAPLVAAGALSILLNGRRALRVELVCSAMFVAVALALNCGVERIARRESVRGLVQEAAARGHAETPVFYMLTDDRTGEFYAGGRLGYRPDGEPLRFDDAREAAEAARGRGGTALVFVPSKWVNQLTDYKPIETELIGDNGVLTLALIRVR